MNLLNFGFDAMGSFSYTTELLDRMPGNPVPMDIVVRDARVAQAAGRITLEQQGFTLEPWPTRLPQKRFYKPENVEREYYPEMEALIKRVTGAVEVVIVNNIVRNAGKADARGNSNPFAGGGNGVNGYANIVHTDFRAKKSVEKFYQRPDHHEKSHAEGGAMAGGVAGKFILINAWRNISDTDPIYNNTLACCDQQTVSSPEDFARVDVPLTAQAHAVQ